MDEPWAALAAVSEVTCFLFYFKDLPDPRQSHKVMYPLAEAYCVLPLCGAGRVERRGGYR